MSGVKDSYVQLRASERDRLMASARRADNMESNYQHALRNAEARMQREMSGQLANIGRRHDRFENALSGMSDNMRRMERENTQRLRNLSTEFQEQGEWFSNALAEQRQALEGQIQDLNQRIETEKQGKADRASQWAQNTRALLEAVDQAYRHEKFRPGELQKLRDELAFTESNIRNGDFESAISKSQETYLRAQTLRMALEQLELEWQAHLNAARRGAAETLALCEAQKVAEFLWEESGESVKAEVDFWTDGKLSALRARAEAEEKRLEAADALSLQDLQQSVVESGQMREAVILLVEQAKEALLASQLRNDIGEAIEEVLTEAGWQLSDATYQGEDLREAMHVKFKHHNGLDELVTIISPERTPDNGFRNKLSVSFFDHSSNDETLRRARVETMTQILREEGLDCTPPQAAPGMEQQASGDVRQLDFEAVRRAVKAES